MAEIEYMHICDYAFPAEGGKPCIIGIFDRISAAAFPTVHALMCIAVQVRGAAHEIVSLKIELGRPNGDVIVGAEAQMPVSDSGGGFVTFSFVNTEFPDAGRYTVKVLSAGRTLTSQSLTLLKVQNTPLQSAPPGSDPKTFH